MDSDVRMGRGTAGVPESRREGSEELKKWQNQRAKTHPGGLKELLGLEAPGVSWKVSGLGA